VQGTHISYPASAAAVVFGRRLSARFPCPAGQEIARCPPLRVASYVTNKPKRQTQHQTVYLLIDKKMAHNEQPTHKPAHLQALDK